MMRGVIEIAGILFLFYSNLLMGEFNRSNDRGKSLTYAVVDIFTEKNLAIGCATALFGFVVFESLRKKIG